MNFIIKKFNDLTLEELYSILKARNKVFIEEQNCPYMDLDSLDQNSYHLFLKEKKEVIAYLRILNKGLSFKEISIGRVLVLEKYRKKGPGPSQGDGPGRLRKILSGIRHGPKRRGPFGLGKQGQDCRPCPVQNHPIRRQSY